MNPVQYPPTGPAANRSFINRSSSGNIPTNEPAEAATFDPLIGRKVWTRWPEDNNFYEAVITDYNPTEVYVQSAVLSMFMFYSRGSTIFSLRTYVPHFDMFPLFFDILNQFFSALSLTLMTLLLSFPPLLS